MIYLIMKLIRNKLIIVWLFLSNIVIKKDIDAQNKGEFRKLQIGGRI